MNYNSDFDDEYLKNEDNDEEFYKKSYEEYHNAYYEDSYEDEYTNKPKKSLNDIASEEDEEEETEENISANDVDDDLAGYFADARSFSNKKKPEDQVKKKPKKIIYKAGDLVKIAFNRTTKYGTILFGPYEMNKKQMYQIELDDTQELFETDDKHLSYKEEL